MIQCIFGGGELFLTGIDLFFIFAIQHCAPSYQTENLEPPYLKISCYAMIRILFLANKIISAKYEHYNTDLAQFIMMIVVYVT